MEYKNEWTPNEGRKRLNEKERKELISDFSIIPRGISYDTIKYSITDLGYDKTIYDR